MSEGKRYRILSLDGGGIRGVISARWLAYLESRLVGRLRDHFDLIAGTSTGSILACGIAKGIPVNDLVDLYLQNGREIFPATGARLWGRVTRLFSDGPSAPKYDGKGLAKVLKCVFGDTRFSALKPKPVLVTSYDVLGRRSVVFKNNRAQHSALPVWEICKASASAPTYFPAHVMKVGTARLPLVDGGVVANNPTACAVAEGVAVNKKRPAGSRIPLSNFVVASLGTGDSTRGISIEDSKEWGALEWAIPVIDVLFDGSADAVDYVASQMLSSNGYFRFQTKLDKAYDDMDDASATNMNALLGIADSHLSAGGGRNLDKLAKLL